MYNKETIKEFKSKLIILTYKTTGKYKNKVSGIITATTSKNVVFQINNDTKAPEIILKYDKIEHIELFNKVKM